MMTATVKPKTRRGRTALLPCNVYRLESGMIHPFLNHIVEHRSEYEQVYDFLQNTRVTADGMLCLYKQWKTDQKAALCRPPSRHIMGKLLRRIFKTQVYTQQIFSMPGTTLPQQQRRAYVFNYEILKEYLASLDGADGAN